MVDQRPKVIIATRLIFLAMFMATVLFIDKVLKLKPTNSDEYVLIAFTAVAVAAGTTYLIHRIRPRIIYR